jgi:hypothetical protein
VGNIQLFKASRKIALQRSELPLLECVRFNSGGEPHDT